MSDHTYIRCEDCRNHGKCRREKSIPRYMVKGCMVEVKDEMGIETVDASEREVEK